MSWFVAGHGDWDFSDIPAGVHEEEMIVVNCMGAVEGQLCRKPKG